MSKIRSNMVLERFNMANPDDQTRCRLVSCLFVKSPCLSEESERLVASHRVNTKLQRDITAVCYSASGGDQSSSTVRAVGASTISLYNH